MKAKMVVLAVILLCTVHLAMPCQSSATDEYKILIDELMKEGVLSNEKADSIKAKIAEARKKAAAEKETFQLPEELKWLEHVKFSGDLRVRYQVDKTEEDKQRHRGRYRFRFGVAAQITDNIDLAAGLATGGADPRSTNQTMQDSFATTDIRFDYGYAQYRPFSWLTLKLGRLKGIPFWIPSDLLWDTDINPDGGSIQLDYKFFEKGTRSISGFFNSGFFILDEWSTKDDPYMYVCQPGIDFKYDRLSLRGAVAYYGFENVKDNILDHSSGTNTRLRSPTRLKYGYDSLAVGAELGYVKPFKVAFIPYVAAIGEYVHNIDPPKDNNGYGIGMKIGYKKLQKKGHGQLNTFAGTSKGIRGLTPSLIRMPLAVRPMHEDTR